MNSNSSLLEAKAGQGTRFLWGILRIFVVGGLVLALVYGVMHFGYGLNVSTRFGRFELEPRAAAATSPAVRLMTTHAPD